NADSATFGSRDELLRRDDALGDCAKNRRALGYDQNSHTCRLACAAQGVQPMNAHEQFAEDLALYALGTLTGDERIALEAHLRDCAACRNELEQLRGDAALLAFSTAGPRPPGRSKERLLSAIAKEPRFVPAQRETKRVWWSALEWAAAAAAIVVVLLLVRQNNELQRQLAQAQAGAAGQQQQLQEAKQLLSTLSSAEADRYVLVAGKTPPQPQGRAIYVASSGTLVFLASHMPELPPEKAYELWLIPT